VYFYNLHCEKSQGGVEFGTYNFFVRKSKFDGAKQPGKEFGIYIRDWAANLYRYVENVTVLDTVFSGDNSGDVAYYPAGSGVVNVINCIRKNANGTIQKPNYFLSRVQLESGRQPELRAYAWLDVLVKDNNGRLIPGAEVTVESLSTTVAATLQVTLPPPPPDLWEEPETPLPQPVLGDFTQLTTLANGKIPGPNYGWSGNPEPCAALLYQRLNVTGALSTGFQYKIKASYQGATAEMTVTPDSTWLCEDPTQLVKTVLLVLGGESSLVTNSVQPTATVPARPEVVVSPNPYVKGKSRDNRCLFANLTEDAVVRVYDLKGELLATLRPSATGAGWSAAWDVSTAGGGIYLYSVQSAQGVQNGKVSIVK